MKAPPRTILLTPRERDAGGHADAPLVRMSAPEFGAWLREQRDAGGMSLRHLGSRMGLSHTYVAQVEGAPDGAALSLKLVLLFAEGLRLDDNDVLEHAGVRFAVEESSTGAVAALQEALQRARDLLHSLETTLVLASQRLPNDLPVGVPPESERAASVFVRITPALALALREMRLRRGLTLRNAAAQLGIHHLLLQKLETKKGRVRRPNLDLLHRVAAVYDVSVQEIYAAAGLTSEPGTSS